MSVFGVKIMIVTKKNDHTIVGTLLEKEIIMSLSFLHLVYFVVSLFRYVSK